MVSVRFLLVAAAIVTVAMGSEDDAYNVTGVLECHGEPMGNASVVFFETDVNQIFGFIPINPDDVCFATSSSSNGQFLAAGYEREINQADQLYYVVKHECNRPALVCSRFDVPVEAWKRNSQEAPLFNVGTLELSEAKVVECPSKFETAIFLNYTGPQCSTIR